MKFLHIVIQSIILFIVPFLVFANGEELNGHDEEIIDTVVIVDPLLMLGVILGFWISAFLIWKFYIKPKRNKKDGEQTNNSKQE